MPKLSVLIATYNRKKTLIETLKSVYRQTYTDFEVILIDDGSSDNTKEIILKNKYPRLRYYYQKNHGLAFAWNRGVKLSKGDWIAFLDSDDLWLPEKIKNQMKEVKNPNVLLVYNAIQFLSPRGLKVRPNHPGGSEEWVESCFKRFYPQPICPSSLLIRRDFIIDAGGFDPSMGSLLDMDFFMRIGTHLSGRDGWFRFLTQPMTLFRLHPRRSKKSCLNIEDRKVAKLDIACFKARWMSPHF